MYSLIRPLLFALDGESSHNLVIQSMSLASRNRLLTSLLERVHANTLPSLPTSLAGMQLKNPVGLAAGLDKHASATAGFFALGFGHVELGTVTPRPQPGNERPRMFRITSHEALINRMGFNSVGFNTFKTNIDRQRHVLEREGLNARGVIGVNVGKNATTPVDEASADYVPGLEFAWSLGDYVTINISSPNTADLRALQGGDEVTRLLGDLAQTRERLVATSGTSKPVFVKIAPDDMTPDVVSHIVENVVDAGFTGIICTNTTVTRPDVDADPVAQEAGGLSGRPVAPASIDTLKKVAAAAKGRISIIGAGGISSADDAWDRMVLGADAVQVYTGLIYQGPRLVKSLLNGLEQRVREVHSTDLGEAIRQARMNNA